MPCDFRSARACAVTHPVLLESTVPVLGTVAHSMLSPLPYGVGAYTVDSAGTRESCQASLKGMRRTRKPIFARSFFTKASIIEKEGNSVDDGSGAIVVKMLSGQMVADSVDYGDIERRRPKNFRKGGSEE